MVSNGDMLYFGGPMNSTTGDRNNFSIYSSGDGGKHWRWQAAVHSGSSGYSDLIALASSQDTLQLGVAFQFGLDLHGPLGGGYSMAFKTVNVSRNLDTVHVGLVV